jgi:hypothetical protein
MLSEINQANTARFHSHVDSKKIDFTEVENGMLVIRGRESSMVEEMGKGWSVVLSYLARSKEF